VTDSQLQWIKARKSYGIGECVELADAGEIIKLRDSKSPDAAPFNFTRREIAAFIDGARNGEFDHLT